MPLETAEEGLQYFRRRVYKYRRQLVRSSAANIGLALLCECIVTSAGSDHNLCRNTLNL